MLKFGRFFFCINWHKLVTCQFVCVCFFFLEDYIDWYLILSHPCNPSLQNKPHFVITWYSFYNFFWFASILLRMLASVVMRHIALYFSLSSVLLSGFGIRVTLWRSGLLFWPHKMSWEVFILHLFSEGNFLGLALFLL